MYEPNLTLIGYSLVYLFCSMFIIAIAKHTRLISARNLLLRLYKLCKILLCAVGREEEYKQSLYNFYRTNIYYNIMCNENNYVAINAKNEINI